jgi:hypothetical protein
MENRTVLTHDGIVDIVGRIEDWKIARIIATGANAAELREAQAGISEKGDLEAETTRRMSGRVARLYDILTAGEPEWPEQEGS